MNWADFFIGAGSTVAFLSGSLYAAGKVAWRYRERIIKHAFKRTMSITFPSYLRNVTASKKNDPDLADYFELKTK